MNMRTNHTPFHIPSLAKLLEQYSLGSRQLRMPAYQFTFQVRKAAMKYWHKLILFFSNKGVEAIP
jgi:hypothetical protein